VPDVPVRVGLSLRAEAWCGPSAAPLSFADVEANVRTFAIVALGSDGSLVRAARGGSRQFGQP
jgi:hypothetical protein